jgi:hypothetical protein
VAQQLLDGLQVVICQQKVTCKGVTELAHTSGGTVCMATFLAETAHPWADVGDIRTSYYRAASVNLITKPLYNHNGGSYPLR